MPHFRIEVALKEHKKMGGVSVRGGAEGANPSVTKGEGFERIACAGRHGDVSRWVGGAFFAKGNCCERCNGAVGNGE